MNVRASALLACIGVALAFGIVARSATAPAPAFRLAYDFGTGTVCEASAVGDLNGDHRADIAVGCGAVSGGLAVYFNRGSGRFREGGEYLTEDEDHAYLVTSVAIGDLDGDGTADVAAAFSGLTGSLAVLLNRGDGTFLDPADYPGGSFSIAVADLNGDGAPDLVAEGRDTSTASIWLNRGNGTFGSRVDYRVGRGEKDFETADVNGDGATDLVTPNGRDHTISVLLNRGDGTFGPRQDYPSGREPRSLAVADLNGDAKPDLAAAVHGGVSILLNLGDGTFRLRREYRVGGSRMVASGDLNGDGKADLAIASGRGVASCSVAVTAGSERSSTISAAEGAFGPPGRSKSTT